ncbi:zinc finger CCCH domain-containing protein 3 isoform X2 [Suncus etruscus]|uniref:zinc finger CCCH domain-containing protein 3 isoform X2 n=1 Tax=Suncus etruscus TaxID=109475 RepID=UPI0021101026|nr:zinc finger CCCH domain-containing protein 3 isoform X2 [Suncus etruscus]
MEEKEQLRRQIRLLQGLIDDYKNHHSSASAPSRWQPSASSAYQSCRAFGTRYSRPSRRGFTPNHGPEWRKKYSLVNRPAGSLDQPGDGVPPPSQAANAGGSLQEPDALQCDPERQVQLSPDQNVIIKIKLSSPTGVGQGPLEVLADPRWSDSPQEGEGEPPVGPMLARGSGTEDPLLVCRKEPGKLRAVRMVSSGSGPSEPRRTVSESSLATRSCSLGASQYQRSRTAPAWKGAPACVGSCTTLILPGPGALPAPSGSAAPQEASTLVSCRSSKFRKNNYKWVASSAKSPRPGRKALSPRATEQVRRELQAEPGSLSPSKYKWKASNPSVSPSSSSFRWQPEAGSKSQVSLLSSVPAGSLPEESIREHPPSAYKVKSRTKIIRRRSCASLSGDKKTSPPPVTTARSQFCLRRRQALRPKSSPVLKKTPNRALMQLSRQRLGQLPAQALLASKEVSSVQTLRTPPGSKVIKTRYRIVQKSSALPFSAPLSQAGSSRRLSLSRSLVLNRLRPATGAGKAQPISPVWRNRGYRCIGGALYRVSANKLSRAASRQGDVGCRTPLRTGRPDSAGSCGRSLACRAVQRSLAIVRQARQRRRKKEEEYCMYYNRFGRCNRGQQCPYIHDPEKVAVCTRFLRGTCKKTDGTCPFSHQVAKEKMPVCSYFLKGICSNSSCPYSHVYVSRKAEVCAGFLKGYCPMGAKCKKKHTLLCPDFSRRGACPRGAQCQLLHRNQKRSCRRSAVPSPEPSSTAPRRNRVSASHGPKKVSAAHRPSSRQMGTSTSAAAGPVSPLSPQAAGPSSSLSSRSPPRCHSPSLSSPDPEGLSPQEESAGQPGPGALSKLPSFISLRSSPSPSGQPTAQTPPSPALKESGKPLHIKPRL